MVFDNVNTLIKLIGINILIPYIFIKIINFKKTNIFTRICILLVSIFTALFEEYTASYQTSNFHRLIIVYIIYGIFLNKLTFNKLGISLIVTTMSISISYICTSVSALFILIIVSKSGGYTANPIIEFLISILITVVSYLIIYLFFRIKRFRNGFTFIKNRIENSYIDIFVLAINVVIIFIYLLLENYDNLSFKYLTVGIFTLVLILIVILQKTFILYQSQKIQFKALKDYEQQLNETKLRLTVALEEKQKLVKSNHEFYHRQEALNKKLDDLINQQKHLYNTEFSEDYGNILDRINNLSDEYRSKVQTIPALTKTNIVEIDDMLSYMQSECTKNKIEFILKIDCNVQYILDNFISKSQLETLIGDLIRNAIIAINHSSNDYKSIMLVFGIKDDSYELCIFDSGIPFNIDTLLNFGLKPSSTHEDEGGTGIGLITTYETINSCNASLIINEITNSNYTKSLEIKFDNKNEYIIISDRSEDIDKMNDSKRNIITKKVIRE